MKLEDWEPNDQQNWEMDCEAERKSQKPSRKSRPLRDSDGRIIKAGDLVWLYDHRPVELAMVVGESHRENILVRMVKGGYDFTVSELGCEKVKPGQYIGKNGCLYNKEK
jgi:hypothetical protein